MGWAGLCGALFSTVTTADVVLQHAEQSSITMDDGKDAILGGSGCISIAEGRVVAILGGSKAFSTLQAVEAFLSRRNQ